MFSTRIPWVALCITACAALLLAAAPTSAPTDGESSVHAAPDTTILAADGKAVYMKKCKKCHGADGKANTKMGKKHEIAPIPGKLSKGKIAKIVKNGKPGTKMKAFGKKLSAEEIDAVAAFVKKL